MKSDETIPINNEIIIITNKNDPTPALSRFDNLNEISTVVFPPNSVTTPVITGNKNLFDIKDLSSSVNVEFSKNPLNCLLLLIKEKKSSGTNRVVIVCFLKKHMIILQIRTICRLFIVINNEISLYRNHCPFEFLVNEINE